MSRYPQHAVLVSLLVLALTLLAPTCASPGGGSLDYVEVDISYFHDDLAIHGEWIQVRDWGWAWAPHGVWVDWRPYSYGCWVSTRYGWTWYSYWDWGWACFHYGRWCDHPQWGWIWVPDRVWGPAWVAWHDGPGYLGWAPLPPQCRWQRERGIRASGDWRRHVPDRSWCFVRSDRFDDQDLRPHLLPPGRNPSLLRDTRDVTDYRWERERIMNRSLTRERVERSVARPVVERDLAWTDRKPSGSRERPDAGRIEVYRPAGTKRPASTIRPASTNRRTSMKPTGRDLAPTPRIEPIQASRREPERSVVDRELERRRVVERKQLESMRRVDARSTRSRDEIERRNRAEEEALRRQAEREARNLEAWRKRDEAPTPRVTRSTSPRYEPTPRTAPAPRPKQPTPAPRTAQPRRPTQPTPAPRTAQPRRPTQPTQVPRGVQPRRSTEPTEIPRTPRPSRRD